MENLSDRSLRRLGPNAQIFFRACEHIGGVWPWDTEGQHYLGCCNGLPDVRHCHSAVIGTVARQSATPADAPDAAAP